MGTITFQLPVLNNPNSTEDPKVTTALQTLLTWANGNVDTHNLSPTAGVTRAQLALGASFPNNVRTTATNTTALNGDLLICENDVSVTFGTVALGAMVCILNVSAGSNVSLLPPFGAQIFQGASGFQASVLMPSSSLGKCWTYFSDGTNWILTSTNASQ